MTSVATGEIILTLPVPPSVNKYWLRGRDGNVYLSSDAKAYKQEVAYLYTPQMITGNVAVSFTVFRPRKIGDLDNYEKALFDALKGILYKDDNQVVEIHAYREDDANNPRVELTAWQVE